MLSIYPDDISYTDVLKTFDIWGINGQRLQLLRHPCTVFDNTLTLRNGIRAQLSGIYEGFLSGEIHFFIKKW